LIDQSWLNATIDLLRDKRQLILYGPPGTGKTYLAQALAEYLATATGGEYRLVQFHPSYSYEDFFEGFRPTPGDHGGTISFTLQPGPFKMLAQQASAHPGRAHVLVIDEINRANLAKVFGELYFLLEYRDREVSLQYSPNESFQLPDNLYVIGTMNTSDRSIALVDAAMRRRFNWRALFPDQPPVQDLLRRWLQLHNLTERPAKLLDALNARIEDRDAKVGPSYLMTERANDDSGIRRIWEHQILPLLEERHAGEGVDVRGQFDVDVLESAAALPAYPESAPGPVEQEEGEQSA
jgi:5-methylcytosine-specific restriction protein B